MDKNKLEKLREVKYQIRKCCATCKFGYFLYNKWSVCQFHSYKHQKHTDSDRELSIFASGLCENFKWNNDIVRVLKTWKEFLEA